MAPGFISVLVVFASFVSVLGFAGRMDSHQRDHIQSHLKDQLDVSQSPEYELRFLYFKMHDTDSNEKLDGCEIVKSLLHVHYTSAEDEHERNEVYPDGVLMSLVDAILDACDANCDGFVDFAEYAVRPNITRTK